MKAILKLRKTTFVALCALALSPMAIFAGSTAKTAEEHGIIKSVDIKAHQLVVTDQKTKSTGTFQWNDQTKFTEKSKPVSVSALKEGMAVHLTYAPGSGTPVLGRVSIAAGKEQKHSATPPAQGKS